MAKNRQAIRFTLIGLFSLVTIAALYFALIRLGGLCCAFSLFMIAVASAVMSGCQRNADREQDANSRDLVDPTNESPE